MYTFINAAILVVGILQRWYYKYGDYVLTGNYCKLSVLDSKIVVTIDNGIYC